MTCCVGLIHEGEVWMGADSAVSWEDHKLSLQSNPKVFRVGPFTIAYAGSGRIGRILQYGWPVPTHRRSVKLDAYVSITVVENIRKSISDGGAMKREHGLDDSGSCFLLAYRGRLFRVDDDFNVDEPVQAYDCVGTGGAVALGSLYSTRKMTPRQRVTTALKAAQEFTTSVRGPFQVLEPRR